MKRLATIFLLSFCLATAASARVVINEVLANEPGSSTNLEWIELFNEGASSIDLGFYILTTGADTIGLSGSLGAGQFVIVAADSIAFKGYWLVPGIPPYRIIQASFSLANAADTVSVGLPSLPPTSQFRWSSAGKDGYSWERTLPNSTVIRQSVDYLHATPGFVNSVTPLPIDLSLDSMKANFDGTGTIISYFVTNRSYVTISDGTVSLYYQRPGSATADSLIAIEFLLPIDTGFASLLAVKYDLPGVYATVVGRLGPDDRNRNDTALVTGPGRDFPPLRLSEIMPNPEGALTSEWIEIRNVYTDSIDVGAWQVGDALNVYRISSAPLKIGPQQYLVAVEDSLAFRAYYTDFTGRLIQPSSWAQLNNNTDIVRMVDTLGFEADRHQYTEVYADNVTLSRRDTPDGTGEWALSDSSGGTPGRTNVIRVIPKYDRIGLTIVPRVFSPDGDGIDEEAVITAQATQNTGYTLEIYDREGRKVRSFEDNASTLRQDYRWDGRDDGGVRLPIGIYVVYFNSVGVESIKKTVVIAR